MRNVSSNKETKQNSQESFEEKSVNFKSLVSFGSTSKLTKSLDYWSKHNPLLMAEEIFFESRGERSGHLDFIFSCIGYSFGLGNTWRFPFMCLKNGGASFLIAYLVMTILIGIPFLFMELCLSQFTSKGVTECWNFSPGFRGLGYCMVLVNLFCCICYVIVLAWILFYGINSLRLILPFLSCDNPWNDEICVPSGKTLINATKLESSSEQFWVRFVTTRVSFDGTIIYQISNNPETFIWYSCSCMIISWIISAVLLIRGGRVIENWYYIFVMFPYCIHVGIIILALQMKGSYQGFRLFFYPNYKFLLSPLTWYNATEQVFFSIGIGLGVMLTMGSYNDFNGSIQRHVFIISLLNTISALLSGLSLFLIVGFMIEKYSLTVIDLIKLSGNGLIFFVYPECFGSFRYPQLTSTLFYFTIFILGIDGMLVMIQTAIAGFVDVFPAIEETKYHRICFIIVFNLGCVVFCLIFVTRAGYNWFKIFEKYSVSLNLILFGLLEVCIVSYIYKLENFSRDYNMMLSKDMPVIWRFILFYVSAPILLVMAITHFIIWRRTVLGYNFHFHVFPIWADIIGWGFFVLTLLPIPCYFIWFIKQNMQEEGMFFSEAFRSAITPNLNWGPLKKRNWMNDVYYKERLMAIRECSENFGYTNKMARQSIVIPQWFQFSNEDIYEDDYSEAVNENEISDINKFTLRLSKVESHENEAQDIKKFILHLSKTESPEIVAENDTHDIKKFTIRVSKAESHENA